MKLRIVLITGFMAFLGHYAQAQCAAYGYFTQSAASAVFYDSSYSVNGHEAYWSFGDSTSGSYGTQVSHTYTANGTYSACLYIYDTIANCNDTTCYTVTITSVSNSTSTCNASFTSNVDSSNSLMYYFDGSTPPAFGSSSFTIGNFGLNDTTYYSQNTSHTFSSAGNYSVYYVLYDSIGNICDSVETTLTVSGSSSMSCNAAFNYSVDSTNSYKLNFNNTSTNAVTAFWRFGDNNNSSTAINPSFTFDSIGFHNVCLTIYDSSNNLCNSICQMVYVANVSCGAFFTPFVEGRTAYFYDTTSSSDILKYDFGDGTNSNSQDPFHNYASAGSYEACLFLYSIGASGDTVVCDSVCKTINITDSTTATCKAIYQGGYMRGTYVFSLFNRSQGASSFLWTFGDSDSSTNHSPIFDFGTWGTFKVCLFALDNVGDVCDSICGNVRIKPPLTSSCNADFTYSHDSFTRYKINFSNTFASSGSSFWKFTATDTFTGNNPSYTFDSMGTYVVCLLTYDSMGLLCDSVCKYVVVDSFSIKCSANFTHSQDSINPFKVYFTNTSTNASTSYWSFGGSNSSTVMNPTFTFSGPGTYTVCLSTYDNSNKLCDSVCKTVIVAYSSNCTPTISNTVDSADSLKYYFQGSAPPAGGYATWEIYEASSSTNYSGVSATHTFSGSGFIRVNYLVYRADSSFCGVAQDSFNLTGASCQASYYLGVDTNNLYNLYIINNSTGTTSATNYSWSFGDGSTSTVQYPTHQYSTFGLYNLCLTISDSAAGCSSTYCDSIGLDSNGNLLKRDGFGITVVDEKDLLSTADIDLINELSIYPNPSNGSFTIKLNLRASEEVSIKAINSLGQEVLAQELSGLSGANEYSIDMTTQVNGIYFLNVRAGDQSKNIKLYINE